MPLSSPIADAFGALVDRRPGTPVVRRGAQVADAGAVSALADAAAAVLDREDLPPGSLVTLLAPGGPAFLAGVLALRRRGLVVLLGESRAPAPEARRIARALGAAGSLRCREPWPRGEADWTLEPAGAGTAPAELPGIGFVKLSSGSTGEPRGIATPEEAVIADDAALTRTMGIRSDDRLLAAIPLSHSYGFSSLTLPALMRGTTLVLPDGDSPVAPLEAAREAEATVFPTTPGYLQGLLRLRTPPAWPSSLRLVISAGAPLSAETAVAFRERFGHSVHVFYGASECGGICYDRTGTAAERGTVGTPVDGVQVTLRPDGNEGKGLIEVRSPAVAQRCLPAGEDALAGGAFRSEDLGRWQDGELALVGRASDWINIDGRKVNPREIEQVLRELGGVREVVVCGVAQPGRSIERIGALIAGEPAPGYQEVAGFCRERLAAYKIPRIIRTVAEIPRTLRGKIDRASVQALLSERAVEGSR